MADPSDSGVTLGFRVRYAESDQMGYAHHGAYVVWLEAGRIEWLRSHGFSYRDLEATGILMPVIQVDLRYQKPLRFDDEVLLRTTAELLGRARICFRSQVCNGDGSVIHAEGMVTVACVGADGRPRRLPPELVALISA